MSVVTLPKKAPETPKKAEAPKSDVIKACKVLRTFDVKNRRKEVQGQMVALLMPAHVQMILHAEYKMAKTKETYLLSWPDTLWLFSFRKNGAFLLAWVFAYPKGFAGLKDEPKLLGMPNTYWHWGPGSVCMGYTETPVGDNVEASAMLTLDAVLRSSWNNGNSDGFKPEGFFRDIEDWHKRTAKDPECYKKVEFPDCDFKTTAGAVRSCLSVVRRHSYPGAE